MRRIKVYSPSLIQVWEKFFINDTAKFIKSTHLERDDLGKTYKERNGTEWKVLGAMEGNEIVCKNLATGELFGISRWKVSMALHPAKHSEWKNGKPKEDAAPVIEELVVITEEVEAELEEETEEEESIEDLVAIVPEEEEETDPTSAYVEPADEEATEEEDATEEKSTEE